MTSSHEAEAAYERLFATFTEYRHLMLHPQYPEALLSQRLPLLRKVPFYWSGSYVMNLVANRQGIRLPRLLRIGEHRPEDAQSLFGRVMVAAQALNVPICGESYNVGCNDPGNFLAAQAQVSMGDQSAPAQLLESLWEGHFFAAINLGADDPLDRFNPEATFVDPFRRGAAPPGVAVTRDVFYARAHVPYPSNDVVAFLTELLQSNKVVFVSSNSEEGITALRKNLRSRLAVYASQLAPCSEWRLRAPPEARWVAHVEPETRVILDGVVYDGGVPC